jgi:hypothetical protein
LLTSKWTSCLLQVCGFTSSFVKLISSKNWPPAGCVFSPEKSIACESSLSRPAVPQSWRGSCCAHWIRWSVYMYKNIYIYIKYIYMWVNYNNSLTWNVGPFGDDFPY